MKKNVLSMALILSLAASNLTACVEGRASAVPNTAAVTSLGQDMPDSRTEESAAAAGRTDSKAEDTPAADQGRVEMKDLMGTTVSVPEPQAVNHIIITSWKGAFGAAILLG